MTQGFYTSISGMSTAQTKIDVIADNIANMNTTAFKQSNVTFQNLFSRTLSSGSGPLGSVGGKNPMQVGFGTKLASITRNFTDGIFQSTGKSSDLYFEGKGYFTVMDEHNQLMLSRAGNFDLDSQGYLVNQNGYRVLGTSSPFSKTGSTTPVRIPPQLNMSTSGNAAMNTADINSLNNFNYKEGSISIDIQCDTGTKTVDIDISGANSMKDIIDKVNVELKAAFGGEQAVEMVAGTGEDAGTVKMVVHTDATSADVPQSISKMKATDGAGGSNFFSETDLANAAGETNGDDVEYKSAILDYKATIGPSSETDKYQTYTSMTVNGDGSIEAKYSNGDSVTVKRDGDSISLIYKTAGGVEISNDKLTVNANAIEASNLQLQLATVVNDQGLTSKGGNLFEPGLNAGELTFSVGGTNGFGVVGNCGLESSNVDLSTQFAEMIIAQRSIEANSRTFDTVNQVLQRIVQLGR